MATLGAVIFGIIVAAGVWNHMQLANGDWHFHQSGFMRRRADGKWQYREMTEAERKEFLSLSAW